MALQPNDVPQGPSPDRLFNAHEPLVVESPTIRYIDLDNRTSAMDRILILTPLRDAAPHLEKHFELLSQLTYPHHAIDLAFLVGDCTDDTLSALREQLDIIQSRSTPSRFRSAMVIERDFGDTMGQGVEERHSFKAQGTRRKSIGRARNYLLYTALKPVHDWVYWRDVDIVECPGTILEDLMKHNKDILVPSRSDTTQLYQRSLIISPRYLVSPVR